METHRKIKPELGVCYYPEHWDETMWEDDASRMKALGLSWVRIGEFAWSRLEPSEGQFNWAWLDRAIEVLGNAGLKVVLGTPSATPPIWVVKKYPDMLPHDKNGQLREFGSRRHYSFSHLGYRNEAARMARDMAKRYGQNPYVHAWQIDNEYGCHDTTLSYSKTDLEGFQNWLAQKYQSADALNRAWGNVFWSMEYASFDDIKLPNQTVTAANPAHWLDFRRYASDMVVSFNRAQVEAMRPHTDKDFIHNYMGRITDFDHFKVADDLDIASWDCYPAGFLEQVLHEEDDEWKLRFSRSGDPDFQAFHHDLYRAVGKGRWWIMEQQPGPVNWARYNPIPRDGMVKLWTMEAIAHGAEVVSYFRWRQCPFAQEQMHAGLLRTDNEPAQGFFEAKEAAEEMAMLGEVSTKPSPVAIVFDYESQWAWEIEPQGQSFDYFRLVFETYRGLRRLGFSVDILPSNGTDFGERKLVLIPGLMAWNSNLLEAMSNFEGMVIAGPRTASKTGEFKIPNPLPPQMPGVDVKVSRVASLRPNMRIPLAGGGYVKNWFEELVSEEVVEATVDGAPVLVGDAHRMYLGAGLEDNAMLRTIENACRTLDLETTRMPEGVRCRDLGSLRLLMNYNDNEVDFEGKKIPSSGYIWI